MPAWAWFLVILLAIPGMIALGWLLLELYASYLQDKGENPFE